MYLCSALHIYMLCVVNVGAEVKSLGRGCIIACSLSEEEEEASILSIL